MKSKLHLSVSKEELSGGVTTPKKIEIDDVPFAGDIFSNINGATEVEMKLLELKKRTEKRLMVQKFVESK